MPPERSTYEYQLERSQFSGLQGPEPLPPGGPCPQAPQGHRHPLWPHGTEPGHHAGVRRGVFLYRPAPHQPEGPGILRLRPAGVRRIRPVRRTDLRLPGQRRQGLFQIPEKAVPDPPAAGGRTDSHRADRQRPGLAGVPGRQLPGSPDGGDRRLRRRGGGDLLRPDPHAG